MAFLNHPAISTYHSNLAQLKAAGHLTETQTRSAFRRMLEKICDERQLMFVEEFPVGKNGRKKVDGAVRDTYSSLGYWEAKDEKDDLTVEIKRKIAAGYPLSNIIFEDTKQAILWQNEKEVGRFDLARTGDVSQLLEQFFNHTEADREGFESAVSGFITKIPELARGLQSLIERESENPKFKAAFGRFFTTCKTALNPQIKESAVKEMLIQHLLTERLFRVVFQNSEWVSRNVIAAEIETVVSALTSKSWSRADFLKSLDPFYNTIEQRARGLSYSEKQDFLNTVYERFFQGYSTETADTMGIVYTPQEIVDWMCESVESVMQSEFGKSISTPGVKILDPCTGTGNFIVNLLGRIPNQHLPHKYAHDLYANEIMLLPYYVASGNIEHEYFERLGEYQAFDGLCFADTLDLFQGAQVSLFAEENTARVEAEKDAEITVIIGNPPYNVGQKNENDNNKNRAYKKLDDAIRQSYAKASNATLQNKLYDAYVRFFKWASERLAGRDGIICFVSNNSFVEQHAFDGMRKVLGEEWNHIWHLDLHGNVRRNPKLSGTTHNVFGIQVGVGITILVRNSQSTERFIRYHRVPELWRKTEKLDWLDETVNLSGVEWQTLSPNAKNAWLTEGLEEDFEAFIPLGSKAAKSSGSADIKTVFRSYSLGVSTNRNSIAYDFSTQNLEDKVRAFAKEYNEEVIRWESDGSNSKINVDDFVSYAKMKWSRNLKRDFKLGKEIVVDKENIRESMYRPFCKMRLYFADTIIDERGSWPRLFPKAETKNRVIWIKVGSEIPFFVSMVDCIPDLLPQGGSQCFPLYTYGPDGENRTDNVTSYALADARQKFGASVSREDVFYATYALLHHPHYRLKYAENLKRELPRLPLGDLPLSPEQWKTLVEIGRALGDLHVGYETVAPHDLPLLDTTPAGQKFSFHVEKMKWTDGKTQLRVNDCITLSGFTPEMFEYRLGNRSALDWVVESYRVKRDERSGLVSDPNRPKEKRFILDLIGQVATVSLETQTLVARLPAFAAP